MRGNKQDPGGFVCRGVGAQRGAASDRANQSNKAHWQFSSVETGTEANHTSSEQRKKKSPGISPLSLGVQLQSLSAARSLTDPGRGHTRASPHPLPSARQTPIHPATDCLSAAAAAAFTVGSSHFLISRRT